MVDSKNLRGKAKSFFQNDKKVKILTAILIAGIVLIALSEFWPSGQKKSKVVSSSEEQTSQRYTQELEEKIMGIVGSIRGVGDLKVLVTLESSEETVYAQETKTSVDSTKDVMSENGKTQRKESTEQKYLLVEGEDGKKQALIKTTKEPEVKGIVIVCEGGDSTAVKAEVINAVTTALDISSSRVCVTKIDSGLTEKS